MSRNRNLNKAQGSKDDEYYTFIEDIELELANYKELLKGKIVYCNCDDPKFNIELGEVNPEGSNFWNYFYTNYTELGLKKLVATGYKEGSRGVKYEYDGNEVIYTELEGDGDFRSEECLTILSGVGIVCTNPPFSLFREYIDVLFKYGVNFLVIGNYNAVTYKEVFPHIKEDRMWLGYSPRGMEFKRPSGSIKTINAVWYTNLYVSKRYEDLILYKHYYGSEEEYPLYDNYRVIEVSRVDRIPVDYLGVMGVPITFLIRYNPEQFEILGTNRWSKSEELLTLYTGDRVSAELDSKLYIDGRELYDRIFIKRRR